MCSVAKFEDLLQTARISNSERRSIELILEAINDWPTPVTSIEEFLQLVEKHVGGTTSLKAITRSLGNLNLSSEAWIGESLTSVQEVILLNDGATLREIVEMLIGTR